jgi:hypothetical protein
MKNTLNNSTPSGLFITSLVTTGSTGGYSIFNPDGIKKMLFQISKTEVSSFESLADSD